MWSVRLVVCSIVLFASQLEAQSDFYKGKQIKIVVGASAGAASDLYARVVAQHLPKQILGKPEAIVQNMPGGGSMTAANYVYSVAKPDGLTLGAVTSPIYFAQLLGRKEVQFDWAKFTWFFFSSRRRHTSSDRDWSSDVCSSDLGTHPLTAQHLHPSAVHMD